MDRFTAESIQAKRSELSLSREPETPEEEKQAKEEDGEFYQTPIARAMQARRKNFKYNRK